MHLRRGRGCGYALAIQCNGPRTGNQRQPDRSMGPDQGYDLRPVLAASIRARMADRMGAGREGKARQPGRRLDRDQGLAVGLGWYMRSGRWPVDAGPCKLTCKPQHLFVVSPC